VATTSRWQKMTGIMGLVVVLWVGNNLFDTISSGGMGSGGDHAPPGGPPTTQPAGGHDPSQFDHS
jgi:hypothetical protein